MKVGKILKSIGRITTTGTAAEISPFSVDSDYLVLSSIGSGNYVKIGGAPSATTDDHHVPANNQNLVKVRSKFFSVISITKGASTVINFLDEYKYHNFEVGDYVTIFDSDVAAWNSGLVHKQITAVTLSSITVDYDSQALADFTGKAKVKSSFVVSAMSDGVGGSSFLSISNVSAEE